MSPIFQGHLAVDPADPLAALAAVIEPYAWMHAVMPVTVAHEDGPVRYVTVEADVKPPPECSALPGWDGLPAHRKALYGRAEEITAAVEAAGWVHDRPPEIDIGGEMKWPNGLKKPPVIIATARLRMWLLPTLPTLRALWG